MKVIFRVIAIIFSLAAFAHADEVVGDFSFRTIDGKTVEYRAADRSPLVVNISAYW